MGIVDSAILVLLGFYFLFGFRTGLTRQIAALLGTLLGLAAAFMYYGTVAAALEQYLHLGTTLQALLGRGSLTVPGASELFLNIISLILIYFGVSILLNCAGVMAAGIIKAAHLSLLDRLGGAGLGLIKGIILCSIVLRLAVLPALPGVEMEIAKSRYAGILVIITENTFRQVESLVPEQFIPRRDVPVTEEV
ncbi:MAG: CvpA family protein [bacterium]|jgi:uncharacterized membrane protein required for colicin V production